VISPLSPSPSLPFYRGGERVCSLYFPWWGWYLKNTRDYKWNLIRFVFTKMPPKATNGPQILFCEPLGYVIRP